MKSFINIVSAAAMLLFFGSCEKYTDISPKGKNLLSTANDLDLLMNVNYSGSGFNSLNQSVLINDMYPQAANVPNIINGNVKNLNYALLTYDESINRADLTGTDGAYEGLYEIISRVANIVLTKADEASGDPNLIRQLKAEALIVRAYMHYILVNIYAKAYDPATATIDGGIPYVEDIALSETNTKKTVQEVYNKMVADVNAALDLQSLPDKPKNNMRVGKAFAYAVKARILLSMRDYAGALEAADIGLKYNNVLEDHRPYLPTSNGGSGLEVARDGLTAPDNLLYAYFGKAWPNTFSPTYEILNNYYEPGNIIKDHTTTYDYTYGQILSGLPGIPMFFAIAYQQNAAGMTTSDLKLIKAEALIRMEQISSAMDIINEIRIRRVFPYNPISASNEAQAMQLLQKANRIEFLFTWRNFADIKRWNKEGKYSVQTQRTINGKTYSLSPTSAMWIFPFPQSATNFNPTLQQNY
ncbi:MULTISPECIES: RagB/SusD family nutrient uptake outer membrane protein [Sphingobacterium]|uniref:RagB/SusD family nutrient uptake outer membrane protein n=1 Tax=Sphingobacterium TaxID=28453 RepID=UPI00257CAC9D|nr:MULTISPECIES: RagB/SusD family nutrient uptake outer membrane protein [Sphingobacterium]